MHFYELVNQGAGGGLIGSIFGMNPFRPASGGSSQPSSSGQSPSSSPTGRKSEPVSCGTRYNEMQSTRRRRDLDASGWLKKEELNEIQAKLNLMLQELERAMGRMNTQTFVQNANATGFFDFGHRHASKLLEGFRKFKRSAEMVERPVRSNDWFGRGNDRTYKNFTLHCSYGKSGDSKTRQNATRFMGSMMDEEPRDNGSGDGEPRKAVEQESRRSSGNAKTTTRRPPVRPNPLKNATLIVIKESRPMHRNGHLPSSNQTSAMSESLRKSILDEIRREFGLKASPINQAVRQSVQINCGGHREGCKSRSHRRLYKSSNQVKPGNNNNALNKRKRFPSNNGNRVEDSGNASNGISGPSGNHSNGHQNNDFNNQPNFDSEYDFSEHPHSGNGANPHSGKRSNEIYRPGRETKNQHSETRADNFSHENSSDSSDEGDHDSNTSEDSNKKDNRRRNPREIMRDINRMYHRFKRAVSTTSQPDGTKTTLPTIQNDARIVGGTQAVPDMYPWLVSIQKENAGHFCGGTIIHEQWIVTAAHCFGS